MLFRSALPGKRVDDGPFTLSATASSGLPVSYSSSNPGVATVSGNTVTITGAGSTTITASQGGNATYLPASSVTQTLSVSAPPVIGAPPAGQAFTLGSAVTLSVGASGTGPLLYQWQFNGMNIAGANAAMLALTNLSATNAGAYRVVVSNAGGNTGQFTSLIRQAVKGDSPLPENATAVATLRQKSLDAAKAPTASDVPKLPAIATAEQTESLSGLRWPKTSTGPIHTSTHRLTWSGANLAQIGRAHV